MPPPPHSMHSNDGRLPSSQAINNTYVPATTSIQQLDIQNLSPIEPPGELRASAIHNYPSSGDVQQQSNLSNVIVYFFLIFVSK